MSKTIVSYKIFIAPDRSAYGQKSGFTAYAPRLGIADDGRTVEEALKNIRALIKFHLDCLVHEGETIPTPDPEDAFVTTTLPFIGRWWH